MEFFMTSDYDCLKDVSWYGPLAPSAGNGMIGLIAKNILKVASAKDVVSTMKE